jgi:hypothetical protein
VICDIGLSNVFDGMDSHRGTTWLGSERIRAPEMSQGGQYSYALDAWSFRIVVYTILTGRWVSELPFREEVKGSFWGRICELTNLDPLRRPTFPRILAPIESGELVLNGIDRERLRAYINELAQAEVDTKRHRLEVEIGSDRQIVPIRQDATIRELRSELVRYLQWSQFRLLIEGRIENVNCRIRHYRKMRVTLKVAELLVIFVCGGVTLPIRTQTMRLVKVREILFSDLPESFVIGFYQNHKELNDQDFLHSLNLALPIEAGMTRVFKVSVPQYKVVFLPFSQWKRVLDLKQDLARLPLLNCQQTQVKDCYGSNWICTAFL